MKIIIKTGFENVTHNLSFKPEAKPKGEALVESGHVRDVHEFREDGTSYLIESRVIRQTAVHSPPYKTQLFIDSTRNVENVSCTCSYRESKACKHIAALIHYINDKESRSKTDVEQQWGGLSAQQFTKQKYSKGKYFYEMFPPDEELNVSPHEISIEELKAPSALKIILSAAHNRIKKRKPNDEKKKLKLISAKLKEEKLKKQKVLNCAKFVLAQYRQLSNESPSPKISSELEEFYTKWIILSEKEIIELCGNTVKQSANSEWFKARRLRVSASKSAHSIKSRKTKTVDKLIGEMLHPKQLDTPALKYGKKMEPVARKAYELATATKVLEMGVIVCKSKPWLCASVDGVVMKSSRATKIVEIKCPSSCEGCLIIDKETNKPKVDYLELVNNSLVLKKSAMIYTQCQIQMYVTGFAECDLFVYSPLIHHIIVVARDEQFLVEVLSKCETFYFEQYLPALKICVENEMNNPHYPQKKRQVRTFTGKDVSNIMLQSLKKN